MLRYWEGLRGPRLAPLRSEIDPVDIPRSILPDILLVDVCSNPTDFRYRLCGTEIAKLHSGELTDTFVADLRPKEYADLVWRQYEEIVRDRIPHIYINKTRNHYDMWSCQAVLHLPFSSDGKTVDLVMGVDAYSGDKETLNRLFEDRAP